MGTISIWIPLIVFSILLMDQEARGAQVPKYLQNKYGTKSVTSAQTTGASKSYSKTVTKTAEGVTKSKASSSSKSITSEPMDYTKKQMGNTGKKVISFQGGCTSMPSPMSAGVRCSQFSGCRADCLPNYQFPNGKTNIRLNCENGQWVDSNGEFSGVPNCEPICMPPCQNNGICLQPNQCSCPENFSGPQCQFENKPCLNYPPMPKSSRRSCSSKKCTISCMDGHEFPDGSQIATMDCKNGMWVPSKEKWVSIPDCQAKCDPPCENGGNCLSFNVCQCPQEYRGPQCQYSADTCSPKLLDFNGGYNCSGDGETFSCSLHCPPGIEFEFPPESVYTCTYAVGFFLPAPIPDCVYPEFSEVIFNGGSSETVYMTNETEISASDRKRIEQLLQHSNLSSEVENILKLRGEEEIITINNGKILENGIDQIKNLVIETKAPTPGTCFSWGGSHYKTFDNRVYSFKSECPHVLLRDSKDGTFSIITDNGANCYQNPENCYKTIYVYFQNAKYVFSKSNGILTFKSGEKTLPIPGRVPGVRVEMSAHNLLVSLDTLGVKLLWDGQLNLQISVKENLWNRTEGLCGVLDGDPKTDLLTQEGIYPKNIMTLALSWRVDSDNKQCNSIPTEDPMCTINANRTNQADQFCNKLIADPKFKLCHDVMDITSLYEACRSDYCNCHATDPTVCSCQTFNVYVQHCKHFGITGLTNWRNDQTCPLRCANGKVYKSCENTSRQPACGSIFEGLITADSSCVEGCFCPEGTVLHEDKCITVDQCPCMLRGKSFKPLASVPKDCNTCTCLNGQWTCTQVDCGARCSAIGDPHYVTFDGKKFDFMGKCSYYLVKTTNFSIEAENVPCAGAISEAMNFPYSIISGLPTCTKTVTIRINDQVIKLKQNHDLVVNGEDITKVPFTIAGIRIKKVSSLFLLTTLPNNIKVWWDGSNRVYIDLPAKFKEQTRGLCGSFNNNQKDDFLTPQDDIEQAVIPFANKWKTSEKCEDLPEAIRTHPCDKNIHKRSKAESYCSKIKAELFKGDTNASTICDSSNKEAYSDCRQYAATLRMTYCHFFVDPDQFYQDCMYDMCSCELPVSKCLCPIIAGYATECSQKGISVDWRIDVRECGVHCPGGQKYQVCGNSCTRTCQDISEEPDCKPQCIEGCNCPEGQTLDNDGQCIPISHCKCTYRGLEFPPGYKEIRPAPKAPELCTCTNAVWECSEADDVDKKLYPSADLLQNRCNASANMEFTTCEPVEPITCKNMHSPELYSPAVCHAGCQCKEGYVLDTTTKTCVKPTQCPCHHANKSYKENAVVQSGCNTCTCKHGKWSCTDRQCAAECSVWGDSHYKTFDGRRFDYQGECDYVLSKGSLGTDSFHVSVQNVPCGTLGTACFRSVTLKVTSGDGIDVVTLEKDKKLPSIKSFKHITIREKGNFVIVEAPELGLVIHWDKGTRVYVRLHPRWKDKTKGLCGNYNNNELDDFQTPSGGLAEVSSNIFGDSWRLQSYCTEAPEIQDTCSSRPERKMWAANKCGILKSSVFAACHYEVPVQYFYEKCVFDTCACDQGGDCECLCTALAAYAQECNNRGVAIKWRTPDFCPMQCDERCTRYHPCITTCPEETCDNLLTNKKYSKNCGEDVCIEGCAPKPCAPGMVYRNISHSECVPIKDCRPICMIIDNVTYYEGDLIEEDDCHSCYCSREEKKCRGQPCTTTTIPTKATTLQMEQIIQCDQGWTQWINQDKPSQKEEIRYTEIEPVPSSLVLIRLKDSAKCDPEMITSIDCRTVVGHKTPKETGLDVECSLERGLVCKSNDKTKPCPDFEIRVLCDCGVTTTTEAEIITTRAPTCIVGESKEDDDDCTKYYVCAFGTVDNHWVEETCAKDNLYNPIKKACDWPKEVLSIRKCKVTTIQPSTTIPTTTYKPTTVFELITTQAPGCIAGERKEDDNDCSKYYTCISDGLGLRWIQDTCVEPKLYNPVKKICDKPEDVVKVRPTCKFSTTETSTEILFTQAPSCILGETKEDGSDCSKYYVCGPGLEENNWISKTCGPNTFYNSITKVCDWIDKVVEVRPACKQEVTEAPKPICPSGTVYDKCAVQCNKLCLYYDHLVKKKGLCRGNVKCEEGCVTAERTKTCPKGSLWLNENTCVQIESCMCVSEDGKPMKPGKVYDEPDCKKCQCINNAYSCQPGICTTKKVLSQATEIEETSGTNKKTKTTAPTEVTEELITKTSTKKAESSPTTSTTKKTKTAPTEGTTEEEITTTTKKHKTAPTEGSETEEIKTTTKKHKTAPTEGTETEEVTTTTKKHKTAPTEGIEGETTTTTKKHKTAPTEGTETEEVTTTTKKHKTSPTEGTETEEVTTTTKKHKTAATEGTEPTEEVFTKTTTKKIETSPIARGTSAIPTVTSSGKCIKDRYVPLIQGDSPLPDSAFNASSVKEDMFAPKYARFNGEVSEEAGGSWAPSEQNQNQWLEINLGKQEPVYGVIIKGSPVFDEYVTSYRVSYSPDGHTFYYILDRTTKQPVVFKGSTDSTTEVKQYFDVPVEARIIRINPRSWNNEIALQVELVGCAEPTTETKKIKTAPTEGVTSTKSTTIHSAPPSTFTKILPSTESEEARSNLVVSETKTRPTEHATGSVTIKQTTFAIPSVTPPSECIDDRYVPLIQGDSPLPDSAFNASSVKEDMFAPKYARFNGEVSEEAGGSWAPSERNQNQWLEINLGKQEPVYGVIIKGSPVFDEYVTSYRVLYSPDGHTFYYILDRTTKQPVVFRGSTDSTTEVKQYFDVPVEARIIRINPRSWNNEISLQVELVGCAEPTTETTRLFTTTTPRIIVKSTPSIQICDDPMGLDDKTMSLSQVYVSSSIALNHRKGHLRLSDKYGWQPLTNSPTEWILFDFLDTRDVTGLVTKGGPDGWVENYIIQYSNNKKEWNTIMYGKNEKVFAGNYDSNFPQVNNFDLPIRTRYFKIIPKKWHNNIQMRVELHGCYKPYPPPKSTEEPTTTLSSKEFECNYCPGVLDKSLEIDACRCLAELWWDGHKCVNRTQCPCYVGYMQYTVGAVYEDEDCSECICKIGGVPFCTPKKCEPCAPGLKSTVTTTCSCTCQPCPTGTTLCPTSNICINSTLWCNGIEDCSDDEVDCTTTTSTNTTPVPTTTTTRTSPKKETSTAAITTTTTPKIPTTTETVKCREVICGPGFKKVLKSKNTSRNSKNKYMSQMIRNNRKTTKSRYAGIKGKTAKKTPPKKWTLSTPAPALGVRNALPKEECIEYICVPVIPYTNTSSEAITICPSVECPEGYILVLEESSDKICQEFNCALPPKPDAVCKITGRTFKTFDGVEFKYDICNHVLARDLQYDEWEISLKKSCREVCSRDLIIQHDWQQFVFHPDFTVEFDGYTYSLDQAIKLAERQADFSITLIGDTVLFTSSKYGFWIIWNHNGDVKIGVDQQLNEKVDGLCGYFDSQQEGDKRKPDGSLSKTTVDFGDSWALSHDQPQICQAKVCPIEMQNKAWAICNNVKEKSLSKCGEDIDVEAFVSRCLENTCNCLQQSISINDTLKENCKCKALESFVGDCLSKNPSLDISNWRIEQNCPAPCDAPLIYHDCYQRRCEPDCATFSDSEACPKIKNMCFPGCYCPAGYVREGNNCVQPSSCKNCECTLLPYLDYITYDENKFTVNGNCTYVMSRDLITSQNKEHQFQVLITNQECQKSNSNKGEGKGRDNQMCVGKVTILYEKHKIHIIKDDLRNSLKIIFDGERVQDFSEIEHVIRVQETSRRDLKILLKRLLISVHIYYPSLGVKLNVPSYTLAEKMEGICGDCNGRSADDFRTPDGKKPKDENDFGLNWLYEGLPGGQSRDQCGEKKEDKCEIKPGEVDPCEQLLDENKFGQCANLLDPTKYVEWCRKQTCGGDPKDSCEILETYALACSKLGICVNWRNNLCPAKDCPPGLFYSPCGPSHPKTCNDVEDIKNPTDVQMKFKNIPTEGCFCAKGKVLNNGTCIDPRECYTCDDEGHHPGDVWNKDKCTTCKCNKDKLICEKQQCIDPSSICERGYNAVKVPTGDEECCDKYTCVTEPTFAPVCDPPQNLQCAADQVLKLETKSNGCQVYICECRPKEECKEVDLSLTEIEPGYIKEVDYNSSCCPVVNLKCNKETCPPAKSCPQFYSLKIVESKCCPVYSCEAPEKCIVETEYGPASDGGERPLTPLEKQKLLKEFNETWTDGPCRDCKCIVSDQGNFVASCSKATCPDFQKESDWEDYELVPEKVYNECCPKFKRNACKYNGKLYQIGETWYKENDKCTSFSCVKSDTGYVQKQTQIKHCEETCDIGFAYIHPNVENECCGYCKQVSCVVNGQIVPIGKTWLSTDFCTESVCLDQNGTILVKSKTKYCPKISEDILKEFIVEEIPQEGECCPKQVMNACRVGDVVVKIGETVPSPTDKCRTFTCVEKGPNELSIQETIRSCKTDCGKGWEYQKSENSCCGTCVQVSCVLEGEIWKEGETWKSPDKCTTFSCEKLGDHYSIVTQQETCPSLEDCPKENIYTKGCCQYCNTTAEALTQCMPLAMKLEDTIGIVKINDCKNKYPIANFTECVGNCESATAFNIGTGMHVSQCACCQALDYTSVVVELECEGGNKFEKKIAVPTKCGCNVKECEGFVKTTSIKSFTSPTQHSYTPTKSGRHSREGFLLNNV